MVMNSCKVVLEVRCGQPNINGSWTDIGIEHCLKSTEEHAGAWRNLLEQAEDEGIQPHVMAGEFRELADLGEQSVEQPCGRACTTNG